MVSNIQHRAVVKRPQHLINLSYYVRIQASEQGSAQRGGGGGRGEEPEEEEEEPPVEEEVVFCPSLSRGEERPPC